MPLKQQRALLEHILRTSKVPHSANMYTIGPFGYRVGFAFQQERALNLVLALKTIHGGDLLKKQKVAIIGGGVAGVTAFVALAQLGCTGAKLFEARDKILSLQAASDHRLVHPNYNKWPIVSNMNSFTDLQLLNWYAAPANEVMNMLREEFALLMRDHQNQDPQTGFEFERTDIRTGRHPIALKFKKKPAEYCDIAIFATGFGNEKFTGTYFKGYWEKDTIPSGNIIEQPVQVIGTGDGALIDLLRCFSVDPDFWTIPLGLIARLRNPHYMSILTGVPKIHELNDAQLDELTNLEEQIREHELSIAPLTWGLAKGSVNKKLVNRICQQEQEYYTRLMAQICRERIDINNFLEEAVKPAPATQVAKPRLRGLYKTPFEPTSAPVNKLLLAFLLNTKRIKYVPFADRSEANKEIKSILRSKKGETRRIDIVRVGSTPPVMDKFSLAGEENTVLTILSSVGTATPPPDDSLISARIKDSVSLDSDKFDQGIAKSRISLVANFFARYFGAARDCAKFFEGTNIENAAFVIQKPKVDDKVIASTLRRLGGLERLIYGFPVAWDIDRGPLNQAI